MNLFSRSISYRVTRRVLHAFIGSSILLCSYAVSATQVVATISKSSVAVNEVFQLMVTVDKSADRGSISFGSLNQDFVTGNTNFGSYNSFSNSKRTVQTQWTVSLAAKQVGTLTIPRFTIDGVSSQPIVLTVTKDTAPLIPSDVVEIDSSLSKHRLYIGETATYKVKLIIKADPRMLQNPVITPPTGDAFTIIANGEGSQKQGVLNGVNVLVVEQQFQIVPNAPGNQSLEGTIFQSKLIQSRRTGSTRIVPITVNSGLINIEVLSKPDGYTDLWLPTNNLTLNEQWQLNDKPVQLTESRTVSLHSGDSMTRTLIVTASDLPQQQLPNISINYPASVSVYDEKPVYGVDDKGNTVMTIKQVLIPRVSGQLTLPEVTIPWWNSVTDSKMNASLDSVSLVVSEDENSTPTVFTHSGDTSQGNVVTDRGYWPYLTGLFALLWLITLALWGYLHRRSTQSKSAEIITAIDTDPSCQNLINAVLADDTIAASRWYTLWLAQHESTLSSSQKSTLSNEMDQFMATQYGPHGGRWDSTPLIDLIRHTQRASSHQPTSHLAYLEPQ